MRVVRCLEHQGYGFGDRHEVADDPFICDGHRPAFCDLLLEERDHAAVAAQHVSEPDGHEVGVGLAVHHLHYHLAQTLGRAHDIGRVHGLVGRDKDEFFNPGCCRSLRYFIGSFNVVFDRLVRAVLHERHMFMRGGVEDDIRMIFLHDALHASCVAHGSDQRHQVELRTCPLQLLLDGVGVVLIDIEDDQHPRIRLGDLPAELAADGTAAARHQDGLSFQGRQDLFVIYFYPGRDPAGR